MSLNDSLSEYIRLLRLKNKLSQEDVANKLKVSRYTYSKWESNPVRLDLDKLEKIGNVLDSDIFIFFNEYVAKSNQQLN